ncbi:hypothetical protein P171DRAFT_182711 [Karstenula rhodostoma CBS 690.94]|uniref:Secreted protein n=1 Tax=Karstenula rhodostoma CBS 690.94 TaxID=1392251 RepID=A0A9P4P344_9PLEO|nr:hypothetical protein P171DRAFT_182711 [Karstenula rhodostoma CBS 690.94]
MNTFCLSWVRPVFHVLFLGALGASAQDSPEYIIRWISEGGCPGYEECIRRPLALMLMGCIVCKNHDSKIFTSRSFCAACCFDVVLMALRDSLRRSWKHVTPRDGK